MTASEGHALCGNPTVVPVVMGRSWWGSSDRPGFRSQGPRTGCCRSMRPWAGDLSEKRLWGHLLLHTWPGPLLRPFLPQVCDFAYDVSCISFYMAFPDTCSMSTTPSSDQQPHLLWSWTLWGLYPHIHLYQSSLLNLLQPPPAFPSSKPARPIGSANGCGWVHIELDGGVM